MLLVMISLSGSIDKFGWLSWRNDFCSFSWRSELRGFFWCGKFRRFSWCIDGWLCGRRVDCRFFSWRRNNYPIAIVRNGEAIVGYDHVWFV